MVLALTLAGAVGAGALVVRMLWRGDELAAWERAAYSLLAGVLLWLASTWAMALTHTLGQPVAVGRSLLLVAAGAAALVPAARRLGTRLDRQLSVEVATGVFALMPVAVWIAFVLWRGAIVPPLNHDALAYHLPKAVMFLRAGGYRTFDELSYLISPRASNYEMLLADAIAGDGTDAYTEWPAALFYVAFVVCGVALAQRWFRCRTPSLVTTALLLAGVPVLLLHSGGHKNDLLVGLFAVGGMVATGRWFSERDVRALVLAVASFAALAGTKTHGAVIALAFAPLLIAPMVRPLRPRAIGLAAAAGLAGILLLGGFDQLAKLRAAEGRSPATAADSMGVPKYGDWQNLWQAPYVLLAAPFAPRADQLEVPWDEHPWFWRRYEIFFSHFGIPFSLAAIGLPFAVVAFRRREGPQRERLAVTVAAAAAFAVLLPVVFVPAGLYAIYMPRFVIFLLPVVFGWIAPAVDLLSARRGVLGTGCVAAAAVVFCVYAADAALHDAFVPLRYVSWARAHPGTRVAPFDPNRVASVVDRLAGPEDRVAFDAGYAAWIYPAYGAELRREVIFIPPGEGKPAIPDVDWIVIDRKFSAVWRNPEFKSLGGGEKFMTHAVITPEDSRVINAVLADARYEPVSIRPRSKQAIFRRRR